MKRDIFANSLSKDSQGRLVFLPWGWFLKGYIVAFRQLQEIEDFYKNLNLTILALVLSSSYWGFKVVMIAAVAFTFLKPIILWFKLSDLPRCKEKFQRKDLIPRPQNPDH